MKLSQNPPRGTYDFYPRDFALQKYIFDTWRKVCTGYGYQEYLGPIVESADIWRAKSGEDVGGMELTRITDRLGAMSELAIRPEMTPTVTRMVSKIYNETPKPIRYFSIANFYRNERPQRGRNREFWQLNFDLFGSESILADVEIISLALEIMLAFNPPKGSFQLRINNRKIIDFFLENILQIEADVKKSVVRTLDKWKKLTKEQFSETLVEYGLSLEAVEKIENFLQASSIDELGVLFPEMKELPGYEQTRTIMNALESAWYGWFICYDASLIRWFDYYDGIVFEMFDMNPLNTRAMFGGGRYNGLADIFGWTPFPAVGSAPGDETFRLFLEAWWLLDGIREKLVREVYYVPLLSSESLNDIQRIAKSLRESWKIVETGVDVTSLRKSLEYANKQTYSYVGICGEEERSRGVYKIKNMKSGEEVEYDSIDKR